jgi:hypothetical protein
MADSVCSYDLDQLDEAWLKEFNGERAMCGLSSVNEEQFERIIEELEVSFAHFILEILIFHGIFFHSRRDVTTKYKQ